jgi:hypothetical protein
MMRSPHDLGFDVSLEVGLPHPDLTPVLPGPEVAVVYPFPYGAGGQFEVRRDFPKREELVH